MAFTIEIKVVPLSGRQELQVDGNGMIKCFLKSAPEKGKANKELIKLLAQKFDIVQRDLEIVSGLTDRKKRIRILTSLTREEFFHKLGFEFQGDLF